jgi:hypothetical protein
MGVGVDAGRRPKPKARSRAQIFSSYKKKTLDIPTKEANLHGSSSSCNLRSQETPWQVLIIKQKLHAIRVGKRGGSIGSDQSAMQKRTHPS